MAEWVLTQENMTYFWPTSFALVGANPISEQDVLSPLTIQTCQMASRGLAHALYSSLREDTSGTAQCYVVAAVESMVRLQVCLGLGRSLRCRIVFLYILLESCVMQSAVLDNSDVLLLYSIVSLALRMANILISTLNLLNI